MLEKKSSKYTISDESIEFQNKILFRIVAQKDFNTNSGEKVHAGDIGGWVESEKNLSQEGSCWIFDNAKALDNAQVAGNTILKHNAYASGNAQISGNVIMEGIGSISGSASASGNVLIADYAKVYGNARIESSQNITIICDDAQVYGNAKIDSSQIKGFLQIADDITVKGVCLRRTSEYQQYLHLAEAISMLSREREASPVYKVILEQAGKKGGELIKDIIDGITKEIKNMHPPEMKYIPEWER